MTAGVTRRALLRWLGWFAAGNAGLYTLVGLRYLLVYRFPDDLVGAIYAPLALIGQMTLLSGLPLLLLVPVALLLPRRGWVMTPAVLLAAAGVVLLFLDTQVFAQNRFHLSILTAALFETPTWVFAGILVLIALMFEAVFAGMVWRTFATAPHGRRGPWLASALALCLLGSAGIHAWGDAVAHAPVTQFTRFLPLYYPVTAKRDLARLGLVDPQAVQRRRDFEGGFDMSAGQLRYPLSPLSCQRPEKPLNVVLILIDALRPDAINPELTPAIAAFRETGIDFANHYSGGNSSRMGFFSMFYGLPTTYWQSFYDLQAPPVLMRELRAQGYQLSLQSAVGFGSPTLADRTVFSGETDLPAEGHYGNADVTTGWLDWLDRNPSRQPFFSFLYYDPPIATAAPAAGEVLPMEDRFQANPEARAAWRSYRAAIRDIDAEVATVLADLRERGLMESTVVMITSDHGYEFDDNHLGYIGHASSFSDAQLRATLLMHWPGRPVQRLDNRTSHHGLPVTLLEDLLGCQNPPSDYSVGSNLFDGQSWQWIMAGSYSAHAIVQPDKVIVSHPGGFVEVLGEDYRPLKGELDTDLIRESMAAMRRYYQ